MLVDHEVGRRSAVARQGARAAAPQAKAPVGPAGARRTVKPSAGAAVLVQLNSNPIVRDAAGLVTLQAMRPLGALRSVRDTAVGVVEAAPLISFAANPLLTMFGANRDAAREQVLGLAGAVGGYVESRRGDPAQIGEDVVNVVRDWHVGIDPTATPKADTALSEIVRVAPKAVNQGAFAFDTLSALYGGAELKGLAEFGRAAKLTEAERLSNWVAAGLPAERAANFATAYDGVGHHFIQRSAKLPQWLGGGPVPEFIIEHPWNILKPPGVDKGYFYKLHHAVDPYYYGGRVPAKYGGGGWSAKKLGWERYDQLGQFWHARPIPLRKAGLVAVGAGPLDEVIGLDDLLTSEEGATWGE